MLKNKYFIITIDTEADNQWNSKQECTTKNSKYLPRFQELSEKYGFKPVWLTTYEMANDDFFVHYFKQKQDQNLCEIGMHLHPWNNPPSYELNIKTNGRPYLIEYPDNIIEKKIEELDALLTQKFKKKPVSHRAGRWVTNDMYFNIITKYGYKIDCSVTPHVDWSNVVGATGIGGNNYKNFSEKANFINDELLEVPVTIRKIRKFQIENIKSVKKLIKECLLKIIGKYQWVRPDSNLSFSGILKVMEKCNKNDEYIMFMIHSSELMPGGSPNFKDKEKIEKLYGLIENIFEFAKNNGYKGITLRDYYYVVKGGED